MLYMYVIILDDVAALVLVLVFRSRTTSGIGRSHYQRKYHHRPSATPRSERGSTTSAESSGYGAIGQYHTRRLCMWRYYTSFSFIHSMSTSRAWWWRVLKAKLWNHKFRNLSHPWGEPSGWYKIKEMDGHYLILSPVQSHHILSWVIMLVYAF